MITRRAILAVPLAAAAFAGEERDFSVLFDGKTLNGWSVRGGAQSSFYVRDSAIVIHEGSNDPTWLRYDRPFENFDFRLDFFVKGWSDGGIFLHAPEHGRPTWTGFQIKLFQQVDKEPVSNSMGSIFPVVAPLKVNVRPGEWNTMRVVFDWPALRVWVNGEAVQDLDVERVPELRHRFRKGYLGIASLSYPLRFRNLRVRELPSKESWQVLYQKPEDLEANWRVSEGEPNFQGFGAVLRGDGQGHIATREMFKDFELQCYIRNQQFHNSGVLFRTEGKGLKADHYEIQLHDVEDAHFPTGSLYYFKRAVYPKIKAGEWFPFQLFVRGSQALVRINGDTVMEYDRLENMREGHVELQAHRKGFWTEFKDVRIKRL